MFQFQVWDTDSFIGNHENLVAYAKAHGLCMVFSGFKRSCKLYVVECCHHFFTLCHSGWNENTTQVQSTQLAFVALAVDSPDSRALEAALHGSGPGASRGSAALADGVYSGYVKADNENLMVRLMSLVSARYV